MRKSEKIKNKPDCSGTYIILSYIKKKCIIPIGKKGNIEFKRGYYAYVGSAFGPGGLRARISRHLRSSKKFHWHIDFLLDHASIKECWYTVSIQNLEHTFAEVLSASVASDGVIEKFGSSDCTCKSHLIYFQKKPDIRQLLTNTYLQIFIP